MAQLGDILAGAAGAPVNRPALDAYVTQGQAMAGLRTAQTEDALVKAQQAREEMDASAQLEDALTKITGSPAQGRAAALMMKSHFGNAQQAFDALKVNQEMGNRATLGDPNQLGTPAQTAAAQAVQGKLEPFTPVPTAYVNNPGEPKPDVQVSPVAESKMGLEGAQAALAQAKADHPDWFKNGQFDPAQLPALIQYVRENPSAAPAGRALTTPAGAAIAAGLVAPPAPGVAPHPLPGAAPAGPAPGAPGAAPGSIPPGATEPNGPSHQPPNGITPAPGVSLTEQAKIRNDFAAGTAAKQTTALNTMSGHARLFDMMADQIANNDFVPSNQFKNLWVKTFGGSAPTNLKLVESFLGREAVRATVNSGAGTGEERELGIGQNAGPQQLHDAASTLRSLAASQLRSLDLRARRGGVDIRQLLDAETQQDLGLSPAAAGPSPGQRPPLASFAGH